MYHKIGVLLASFADVLMAFIPRPPTSALRSMKFLSWKPTNHSQLPIFWKVAFDLYDLRENVSIDMADIEVGRAGNSRNPSSSWLVDIFSYRLIPSTTFGFRYRSWNCWSHSPGCLTTCELNGRPGRQTTETPDFCCILKRHQRWRYKRSRGRFFSLVYGNPEVWLKTERWRKMLSSNVYSAKLCAIAIDEAHVIKQW